jgi:hypothetical protein
MLLSSLSFFQIIVISLLDLLIAAAIADRIATAGALIFSFNFSVFAIT